MLNQSGALDQVFHALSDPTRRAIVERLGTGAASVTDLARPFTISMPAVMQHLRVLEQSGIVRSKKAGRVRTCRIEPTALEDAERWIQRQASWERRLDRLGDVLAKQVDQTTIKGVDQ
jgi:DNA-binding transcriptional ArsR family regulator